MPVKFPNVLGVFAATCLLAHSSSAGEFDPQSEHGRSSGTDQMFFDQARTACEYGDPSSFWDAFVISDAVRERHTADAVLRETWSDIPGPSVLTQSEYIERSDYDVFPIALIDHAYKPTIGSGYTDDLFIAIRIHQGQNENFVVSWTAVRYGGLSEDGDGLGNPYLPDGELYDENTAPNDGELLFEMKNDCWKFARDLRYAHAGSAPAVTAVPAVNEGYDWALRINDEERVADAILAYEVAETDDQPMSFVCEQGGNRIFAGIVGGTPDLSEIELVSGEQSLHLMGRTEGTEIEEMPYFTSQEFAGDSPFIAAFAANGWLQMTAGGTDIDMVATGAGKQAITRFVDFCTG